MSGCNETVKCPNCHGFVRQFSDHRPYEIVEIGPCTNCGFSTRTQIVYLALEEINAARAEYNEMEERAVGDTEYLEPLEKLPKQNEF